MFVKRLKEVFGPLCLKVDEDLAEHVDLHEPKGYCKYAAVAFASNPPEKYLVVTTMKMVVFADQFVKEHEKHNPSRAFMFFNMTGIKTNQNAFDASEILVVTQDQCGFFDKTTGKLPQPGKPLAHLLKYERICQ